MTVVQICVSAYLAVGALAASVIWIVLIGSKRRSDDNNGTGRDHTE